MITFRVREVEDGYLFRTIGAEEPETIRLAVTSDVYTAMVTFCMGTQVEEARFFYTDPEDPSAISMKVLRK